MKSVEATLKLMLEDVKNHQRSKDTLLEYYVNFRLNKALDNYYSQLLESYSIVSGINEVKVLKNLIKK